MVRESTPRNLNPVRHGNWMILLVFAFMVALLGGASRYDAIQILPLRALSALFLIPALLFLSRDTIRLNAFLVIGTGLLAVLMLVQLVPLPSGLWHMLPARDAIARMDDMLGYEDVWRPLTLAPMRTWNALGSLIVPATALLLAITLRAKPRVLLQILGGIGLLNAALGLLQVLSSQSSALYLYELTNRGSAVGIFANENHSAIFAACSLLIFARLGIEAQRQRRGPSWLIGYCTVFFLIFFVALISGSRAGFAASLGAVLISFFMVWMARAASAQKPAKGRKRAEGRLSARFVLLVPLVALGITVAAFIVFGRATALQSILTKDAFADLRWTILSIEIEMASKFWILGSGFGSFEQVYKIFEPSELLMPMYVNQAHNDWIQTVIEGGVIAVLLLIALVLWAARNILRLTKDRSSWVLATFWISILGIIGAASVVDYPLRTPIFQFALVWLLIALSHERGVAEATETQRGQRGA